MRGRELPLRVRIPAPIIAVAMLTPALSVNPHLHSLPIRQLAG